MVKSDAMVWGVSLLTNLKTRSFSELRLTWRDLSHLISSGNSVSSLSQRSRVTRSWCGPMDEGISSILLWCNMRSFKVFTLPRLLGIAVSWFFDKFKTRRRLKIATWLVAQLMSVADRVVSNGITARHLKTRKKRTHGNLGDPKDSKHLLPNQITESVGGPATTQIHIYVSNKVTQNSHNMDWLTDSLMNSLERFKLVWDLFESIVGCFESFQNR